MNKTKLHKHAGKLEDTSLGFRDVRKEHTLHTCEIESNILPSWIKGTLYKQSGGAFGNGFDFLDGLAHVVAFKMNGEDTKFSNKYMRTQQYADFVNTGEREWGITATEAQFTAKSVTKKALRRFLDGIYDANTIKGEEVKYSGSNPNVTFWMYDNGESMAAITEGDGQLCRFDKDTLETLPAVESMPLTKNPLMGKSLMLTNCSHYFREGESGGHHVSVEMEVKVKPSTGSIIPWFTYYYNIYHGDTMPLKLVYQEEIATFQFHKKHLTNSRPELRPSFMHTTAKTENYLILILSSFKWDYCRMLEMDFSDGVFGLFPQTERNMEFMVMKCGPHGSLSKVGTFMSDTNAMAFHIGNSFEEVDENGVTKLVLETTLTRDFQDAFTSSYERFTIDLSDGSVQTQCLYENYDKDPTKMDQWELVNINPDYHQKRHRYVYGLSNPFQSNGTISKFDVKTNKFLECQELSNPKYFASEPVFVPKPNSKGEEDGVLLTVVSDTDKKSYMFVIDPADMTVISKVHAPAFCNFGLHTVFVPETKSILRNQVSKL